MVEAADEKYLPIAASLTGIALVFRRIKELGSETRIRKIEGVCLPICISLAKEPDFLWRVLL